MITKFIDHAKTNFSEELECKTKKFYTLRTKEKTDFLEKILDSFCKELGLGESDFKAKEFKDLVKEKEKVVWALFNLVTEPDLD